MIATRSGSQPGSQHLLRVLGLAFGVAVTVGGTIGVGILRTPGKVAAATGSVWLMMALWIGGGAYILASALTVAEVAAMLPRAGGFYVYAKQAFGGPVGFAAGWSDWVTECASIAYLALSVGDFWGVIFPAWKNAAALVGTGMILLLTLFQLQGIKAGSRTQKLTSAIQAGGFLLLVAACFAWRGDHSGAVAASTRTAALAPVALIVSLRAILGAYDGWYSAIYFAEEDRDPGRNIPRSMIGGVLAVIGVYLLLNLAFFHVLGLDGMAHSDFPAADAAHSIFGSAGARIVTVLSLLSLPAVMSASLLAGTRVLFAMSRDGLFWNRAAEVNRNGTPATSLLIGSASSLAMLFTGSFDALLGLAGILTALTYCLALLSLFVLRRKHPEMHRPFRAPGYPWLPGGVIVVSITIVIAAMVGDRFHTLVALGLIACSYPAYRLCSANVRE